MWSYFCFKVLIQQSFAPTRTVRHSKVQRPVVLPPPLLSQYAKDFYLGQWLQDMQVELEKALRNSPVSSNFPSDPLALDNGGAPGISQSASVLQLAEAKKDVLHSLMDPAALRSLRWALAASMCTSVDRFTFLNLPSPSPPYLPPLPTSLPLPLSLPLSLSPSLPPSLPPSLLTSLPDT